MRVSDKALLRTVMSDGAIAGLLRIGAVLAMLAFVAAMSTWLDPVAFGTLAMLVSLATLAAGFGGFGQAEMILRRGPTMEHLDPARAATAVTEETIALATWASLLPAILIAAAFAWRGEPLSVSISAMAVTVVFGIMTALSGAGRAAGRFVVALAPREMVWRLMAIIVVGGAYLMGWRGLEIALPAIALCLAVALAWQMTALRIAPRALIWPGTLAFDRRYIGASVSIAISMLALTAVNTLDVVMVGARISPEAAAAYYPANRIALLCAFASLPIQMVIEPHFARAAAASDHAELQRAATLATLLQVIFCLGLGVAIVAAFPVYSALFPTATPASLAVLAILVGGLIAGAIFGLPGSVLLMAGFQRPFTIVNIVFAIVAAVSLFLAAGTGSLVLVATIVSVVEVSRKAVQAVLAYRYAGILPAALTHREK